MFSLVTWHTSLKITGHGIQLYAFLHFHCLVLQYCTQHSTFIIFKFGLNLFANNSIPWITERDLISTPVVLLSQCCCFMGANNLFSFMKPVQIISYSSYKHHKTPAPFHLFSPLPPNHHYQPPPLVELLPLLSPSLPKGR